MWQHVIARFKALQILVKNERSIELQSVGLALVQNVLLMIDSSSFTKSSGRALSEGAGSDAVSAIAALSLAAGTSLGMWAAATKFATVRFNALAATSLSAFAVAVAIIATRDWSESLYDICKSVLGVVQMITCFLAVAVHFTRCTFLTLLKRESGKGGPFRRRRPWEGKGRVRFTFSPE